MTSLALVRPTRRRDTEPRERRDRAVDRFGTRLWAVGGPRAPMGAGVTAALGGWVTDDEYHTVDVSRSVLRPDMVAFVFKKDGRTAVMVSEAVPDALVMPVARHAVEHAHQRPGTLTACSTHRNSDYCSTVWHWLVKPGRPDAN